MPDTTCAAMRDGSRETFGVPRMSEKPKAESRDDDDQAGADADEHVRPHPRRPDEALALEIHGAAEQRREEKTAQDLEIADHAQSIRSEPVGRS